MLIFIDTRAADLFRPTTQDGGRRYYAAVPPWLAIIRCDDMDLDAARGRVVDAQVGWDQGTPGFVREANEGEQHTKITIRRVTSATEGYTKTLLQVLGKAPKEEMSQVLDQIRADAREEAREFLHAQATNKQSHGAGWDERTLTWLMVQFWARGWEEAQKHPAEKTPRGG